MVMANKIVSNWFCDECRKELFWGEKVVLLSGGELNIQNEGPSVDEEPWWGVYHEECYEKRFYGGDGISQQ